MEKFPGREPNPEAHENQKKWHGLEKFALMGALLVGGGMMGEYNYHQGEVKDLDSGHKQTFVIDQPGMTETGGIDESSGRRGDFSVQKEKEGGWIIEGEIRNFNDYGRSLSAPMHKVRYELPASVPASQVEDIFKNISQSDLVKQATRQSGNQLSYGGGLRPMDSLIGSAEKGTIEDYSHESGKLNYRLEVDMDKQTAVETRYFGGADPEKNKAQVSIPLNKIIEVETQHDSY